MEAFGIEFLGQESRTGLARQDVHGTGQLNAMLLKLQGDNPISYGVNPWGALATKRH